MLEILIVVGIFTVLASLVFPLTIQDSQNQRLQSTLKELQSATHLIQQNAYSRLNNLTYGIAFSADRYTTFTGNTLATGANKTEYILPTKQSFLSVTLTGGGTEFVFQPGSFRPNKFGTIRLTDSSSVFVLDINREGLIQAYREK
jgi:type II secretory pathway pseudopilin PulG